MSVANWIPAALANHLWQSTMFAAGAALLTLPLRKNRAQTRYAVWLIASLKFLVPFSVLVTIGTQLKWSVASPVLHPALSVAVRQIGQAFAVEEAFGSTSRAAVLPPSHPAYAILFGIWLCGFAAVLFLWLRSWLRVRAAVRSAAAVPLDLPIKVLSSRSLMEPGVFGIFRPVLLLPAGITGRLAPAHLEAILAHELCHVRRRDNFTAALHMLVEAVFWFHPMVWWIGARLIEERECACDEEVLRRGNRPQIYAEGILKTCQFYLESSLPCVAGVTGSDLKKRVVRIMTQRVSVRLNPGKKLLLAVAAITAFALPLATGLMNASQNPSSSPSTSNAPAPSFEVAAIKLDKSGSHSSHWRDHSGKMFATNITLKSVVERAYEIHDYQISGPEWLNSERYDIEAEAPASIPKDQIKEQLPLMLQNLLSERFKLTFHREEKVLPVYALLVAKNGLKLQAIKDEGHTSINSNRGHMSIESGTLAQIAEAFSRQVDRPVLDQTSVQGSFKCELQWTPDDNQFPSPAQTDKAAAVDSGPSIFTAVQEQLGLKLVPQKAPVEILVIDHVERIPTEN
jgi:uncharacterized protein (TIGR03435 family)